MRRMRLILPVVVVFGLNFFAQAANIQNGNSQNGNLHKSAAAAKEFFERNLLRNPGAEAKTDDNSRVPDWSQANGITVETYGRKNGEWAPGISGCPTCGEKYFRFAFSGDRKQVAAAQTVDVSPMASQIDAGKVTATLGAYLGTMLRSDSTAQFTASYQDLNGKELGTLATDPVNASRLPKPAVGEAALMLCLKGGLIPRNTRRIVVAVLVTAAGHRGTDRGFADNLSLVLMPAR